MNLSRKSSKLEAKQKEASLYLITTGVQMAIFYKKNDPNNISVLSIIFAIVTFNHYQEPK